MFCNLDQSNCPAGGRDITSLQHMLIDSWWRQWSPICFFFSIKYTEKEFQQAMHSHINKVHKGLHLLTCMFYTTSEISQHKDLNITWKPTKHCQISSYKSTQLFKLSNNNIINQSNMKILKDKFKGKKPLFSPKMNDRFHFKIINHFVNNSLAIYILATTSRFPSFI